jgi:hypothetical protein
LDSVPFNLSLRAAAFERLKAGNWFLADESGMKGWFLISPTAVEAKINGFYPGMVPAAPPFS